MGGKQENGRPLVNLVVQSVVHPTDSHYLVANRLSVGFSVANLSRAFRTQQADGRAFKPARQAVWPASYI